MLYLVELSASYERERRMTENTITCTDFYSLEENIIRNFTTKHKLDMLAHTLKVRDNALILARKYVIDYEQAKNAALLHDISALIPVEDYLSIAETLDLEIFSAERECPSLLHQRISRIVAVETFNIVDKEVLNAINCHTTLRKGATKLDKLLFLADKLSREGKDAPAYMPLIRKAAEVSLDNAVKCYFENFMLNKAPQQALHPWMQDAWNEIHA